MTSRDRRPALTILGGGPAGLGVALYAHRAGVPFVLLERASTLGGLCRTFRWRDHRYDSGAHRFHDRDPEITRDVRDLMGSALMSVDAPSQIHHRGRYVDFPPTPISWLRGQGFVEAVRVGANLLACRSRPRAERSFEDRAINRYGDRLGRPLLIDYSEKLWGMRADQLAPEVATRRLPGLGLAALAADLLPGRRSAAHLDGAFLYPRLGYGALADRMAACVPASSLRTEHEVTGFDVAHGRIAAVHLAGRGAVPVRSRVVSTLPLGLVVRLLGEVLPERVHRAAARLRFREVRLVFLRLGLARCSSNASIYLPAPEFVVSRVVEPKNRSAAMAPAHETGLVAEVPCWPGDALSSLPDEALARRVAGDLERAGLVEAGSVLEWRVHRLPNAYPVHTLDAPAAAEDVRRGLASIRNLDLLGRAGRFWYSHLHDQLRLAKDYVAAPPHPRIRDVPPARPSFVAPASGAESLV